MRESGRRQKYLTCGVVCAEIPLPPSHSHSPPPPPPTATTLNFLSPPPPVSIDTVSVCSHLKIPPPNKPKKQKCHSQIGAMFLL